MPRPTRHLISEAIQREIARQWRGIINKAGTVEVEAREARRELDVAPITDAVLDVLIKMAEEQRAPNFAEAVKKIKAGAFKG
jgi:hypothetical protein